MDTKLEPRVDIRPKHSDDNSGCLVDLVSRAENTTGGVDENPGIVAELDRHVLMDIQDGDVELMCQRCPVLCTVKLVGEKALTLIHNREECADR